MPALTSNTITADGTYTVTTFPGLLYVLGLSGTFGSGTLTLKWVDDSGNATTIQAFTAAGTLTFRAPSNGVQLVLAGATDPVLVVSMTIAVGADAVHVDDVTYMAAAPVNAAQATAELSLPTAAANTKVVTIAGQAYTFRTALAGVGDIKTSGVAATDIANLILAVNGVAVTTTDIYACAPHPTMYAIAGSTATKLVAVSRLYGDAENARTVSTTVTGATWSPASTLGGGTDGTTEDADSNAYEVGSRIVVGSAPDAVDRYICTELSPIVWSLEGLSTGSVPTSTNRQVMRVKNGPLQVYTDFYECINLEQGKPAYTTAGGTFDYAAVTGQALVYDVSGSWSFYDFETFASLLAATGNEATPDLADWSGLSANGITAVEPIIGTRGYLGQEIVAGTDPKMVWRCVDQTNRKWELVTPNHVLVQAHPEEAGTVTAKDYVDQTIYVDPVLVAPAVVLSVLELQLPACLRLGQIVTFVVNCTVTALTVSPDGSDDMLGTTLTACVANEVYAFECVGLAVDATAGKWLRTA